MHGFVERSRAPKKQHTPNLLYWIRHRWRRMVQSSRNVVKSLQSIFICPPVVDGPPAVVDFTPFVNLIPPEIFHQILLLLPTKDLDTVRLVCRHWRVQAWISFAIAFNDKKINITDIPDLDRLVALSEVIAARPYITSLSICSSWGEGFDSEEILYRLQKVMGRLRNLKHLAIEEGADK